MAGENGNEKDRVWEIITQGDIPTNTLRRLNDIFHNQGSGLDMWHLCTRTGTCGGYDYNLGKGSVLGAVQHRMTSTSRKLRSNTVISTFRVADILFPDTKKALEESGVQVQVTGYWEFNPIGTVEKEHPPVETGLDRLWGETSQCIQ